MVVTETGKALEEAVHKDQLVISVKHIKPRRRARAGIETLLAVDFPGSQQKMVLQLDRRSKRGKSRTISSKCPLACSSRVQHNIDIVLLIVL